MARAKKVPDYILIANFFAAHLASCHTPEDGHGGKWEAASDLADRAFEKLTEEARAYASIMARGLERTCDMEGGFYNDRARAKRVKRTKAVAAARKAGKVIKFNRMSAV